MSADIVSAGAPSHRDKGGNIKFRAEDIVVNQRVNDSLTSLPNNILGYYNIGATLGNHGDLSFDTSRVVSTTTLVNRSPGVNNNLHDYIFGSWEPGMTVKFDISNNNKAENSLLNCNCLSNGKSAQFYALNTT